MSTNTTELLIGALAVFAIAIVALVVGNVGKHMPPTAEPEPEPDLVELPDHRVIDRQLAEIIGSPTTSWGESVRLQYRPEDFESALSCLSCQREILPGQWFWDTPLLSKRTRLPLGVSFQTCLSCQPGDLEAVVNGQ